MTLQAELYWSFRSPWSYLGTKRYRALEEGYDLTIAFRPVWPLALREPDYFTRQNPLWRDYFINDLIRSAEYLGIPITWPDPDPIVMNMETYEVAEEQPYICWLTHLGVEAARRGRGLAFADEVSTLIWGSGTKHWHEGEHLAAAAAKAGLDLQSMKAAISGHEHKYDEEIERNQKALQETGHWGVPTFVFEGEPFFGQDRIDLALWRMRQKGLIER